MFEMTTANVQVGAGMSYAGLSENHYEKEKQDSITRDQADYDFLIHEHVILNKAAFSELQEKQQKMIEKRDQKYRDRREYKKIDGTIEKYYQRKNDSPKVKYKQSNNFPILLTCGNTKDYEEVVQYLELGGFSENDVRKMHVVGLKNAVQDINKLGIKGLMIDEYYVHANEKGVPHIHGRMLLDSVDGHGNPSGNFGKVLKDHYGEKYVKKAMEKFREDTDKQIMLRVKEQMYISLKERRRTGEFKYKYTRAEADKINEYFELTRTEGPIFEHQQEYINHELKKELEEKIIQQDVREKELDSQEKRIEKTKGKVISEVNRVNNDISRVSKYLDKKEIEIKNKEKEQDDKANALVIKHRELADLTIAITQREKELEEKKREQEEEEKRIKQELRKEKLTLQLDTLDSVEESINTYDPTGDEYVNYADKHGLVEYFENDGVAEIIPKNHIREKEERTVESLTLYDEDVAENYLKGLASKVSYAVRELPTKLKELTNRIVTKDIGKHIDRRVDEYFQHHVAPQKEHVKSSVDSDTQDIIKELFRRDNQYIQNQKRDKLQSKSHSRQFDL